MRNGKIDLLRFIFALFIMMLHSGYNPELRLFGITLKLGTNGGFAVIFFFILSGYFLAKTVDEHSGDGVDIGKSTIAFMKKKYLYYFKWYIVAFIMRVVLDAFKVDIISVFISCVYSIPNLLLLGSLGFSSDKSSIGYYVGASWYISTLFISQFILYPLMKYNYKKYIRLFAPCVFLAALYLYMRGMGDSFAQSFTAMSFGSLIYEFTEQTRDIKLKKGISFLLKLIEVFLYSAIVIYMSMEYLGNSLITMMFVTGFAIMLSCNKWGGRTKSIFDKKFFFFLGKLSFPLYLLHIQVFKWLDFIVDMANITIEDAAKYAVYYALAILLSILLYFIYGKMKIINWFKKNILDN